VQKRFLSTAVPSLGNRLMHRAITMRRHGGKMVNLYVFLRFPEHTYRSSFILDNFTSIQVWQLASYCYCYYHMNLHKSVRPKRRTNPVRLFHCYSPC